MSRSDSGKLSATEARRRLTTSTISTLPNAFVPYIITVAVGDSVTFAFGGDIDHNVIWRASNPSGAPANIENATNETFVRRLTTRGTFNYECTVHPGMIGQIVVR
ncbi:MAG: plastocyanin/azurin family copper-binding protein [bacterium]